MNYTRAARILVPLLFETESDIDDAVAAPNHGRGYSHRQREDLIDLFHDGLPLPRIAEISGRTQLAVAIQLIEHDTVPIPIELRALIDRPAAPDADTYRARLRRHADAVMAMRLGRRSAHARWSVRRSRRAVGLYHRARFDGEVDLAAIARACRRPLAQTVHRLVDTVLDAEEQPPSRRLRSVLPGGALEIMARWRAGQGVSEIAERLNAPRDEVGALILLEASGGD